MSPLSLPKDQVQAAFKDSRCVFVDKSAGAVHFLRKAHQAWARKEILVIEGGNGPVRQSERAEGAAGWFAQPFEEDQSQRIAQVVTTSGTSGPPKLVAISRAAVGDTVRRLREVQQIDASIREYVAVPPSFSFGLARVRAVGAVGGMTYVGGGFKPDVIASMLRDRAVNAISMVPSMLRTLLSEPSLLGGFQSRVRWLEIGSQYMSADEKRQVRDYFRNARIIQHYGLTEASRSTFLCVNEVEEDRLESVGSAVAGSKVRISEAGLVQVAGPHLASGYIVDGELTPLVDSGGWFTTADIGEIREGCLFYKGRKDDVANIGGIKVSSEFFEGAYYRFHGSVDPIAAAPVPDPVRGQKLAVFCTSRVESVEDAVLETAKSFGLGQQDIKLLQISELPSTDTGKIARSKLASLAREMLEEKLSARPSADQGVRQSDEARIIAILEEVLGLRGISPEDSFYDLGGDSLSAVGVMIRCREAGMAPHVIQMLLDGLPVVQIASASRMGAAQSHATRSDVGVLADALNGVRGLLAVLILVSHWGPFFVERAGEAGRLIWGVVGPILRIGTPGFAMIFGVGLAFFYYDQLKQNPERTRKRIGSNTILLAFGVLITAVVTAVTSIILHRALGENWPEVLFYNVLLFYVLMIPSSILWLRIISMFSRPIIVSLVLALGAYSIYTVFVTIWPTNNYSGWLSLGWHMLVAPYAYPRLFGAASLGLAAGLWIKGQDGNAAFRTATRLGVFLASVGFLLLASLRGGVSGNAGSVWAVIPFAGVTLLLYAGALGLILRRKAQQPLRAMVICGILAFPIFIAQGLVIPISNLFEAFGLAKFSSAAIVGLIFLMSFLSLGRKVYNLRFPKATAVKYE